ncbi:MAG: hypothetical protein L0216_00325 [Planctomycetales bacterium]|nr:hypothetical protein [Planctomycetales bacterium]
MAQVVTCPHCQGNCAVDEAHLGMALKCPRCGGQFTPGGGAAKAGAPVAAAPKGAAAPPPPPRRPAPVFVEKGSARERLADRQKKGGDMEKWLLIGAAVAVPIVIGAILFGGGAGKKKAEHLGEKTTAEELLKDPEMKKKIEFMKERQKYFDQQEQTPGAKRSYERAQKQGQ